MRWLALLAALVPAAASAGMMPSGMSRLAETRGMPLTDPSALAYVAAAGITSPTRRWQIGQAVTCLKASGTYAKLGEMFVFAAPTSGAAMIDVIDPSHVATAVNSPSFSALVGEIGDGVSSYLDLNDTYGSARSKCSQNGCTIGAWAYPSSGLLLGTSANAYLQLKGTAYQTIGRVHTATTGVLTMPHTGASAHYAATRNGASVDRVYLYDTPSADVAAPSASNAIGGEITALRSAGSYNAATIRGAYIGAGMTDADVAALNLCVAPIMAVGQ